MFDHVIVIIGLLFPQTYNDENSWRANGKPLLFDGNSQSKRAFDAVIAEAKKAVAK